MRFHSLSSTFVSFSDCTLFFPCSGVGEVSNFAVEALLYTHSAFELIGYMDDPALVQAVGTCVSGEKEGRRLVMPMEVYFHGRNKIVVIQQHCPVLKNARHQFVDRVLEFYELQRFKSLVVLSSAQASRRIDSQLIGSQVRFFVADDSFLKMIEGLGILPLEQGIDFESNFPFADKEERKYNPVPDSQTIPGSQIVRLIHEEVFDFFVA